jgi:hypothetical protein
MKGYDVTWGDRVSYAINELAEERARELKLVGRKKENFKMMFYGTDGMSNTKEDLKEYMDDIKKDKMKREKNVR